MVFLICMCQIELCIPIIFIMGRIHDLKEILRVSSIRLCTSKIVLPCGFIESSLSGYGEENIIDLIWLFNYVIGVVFFIPSQNMPKVIQYLSTMWKQACSKCKSKTTYKVKFVKEPLIEYWTHFSKGPPNWLFCDLDREPSCSQPHKLPSSSNNLLLLLIISMTLACMKLLF